MIARNGCCCESSRRTYCYTVDREDVIRTVTGPWDRFARDNEGEDVCSRAQVIGRSLWDFVTGAETRHLYRALMAKVREDRRSRRVSIRCDSPEARRFLRVTLSAEAEGGVHFCSEVLRIESRPPVELLRRRREHSDEIIAICSFCKAIEVAEEWLETEEGVNRLHLFEKEILPRLSHGVCPTCYEAVMRDLDEEAPEA